MARHPSSAFTVRQYMLAKDFELYYYNDVNLRSVEMHQHDYVECYFFLEGKVEMQLNRQKCQPVPGDVLIFLGLHRIPCTSFEIQSGMCLSFLLCRENRRTADSFPSRSFPSALRQSVCPAR